MTDTTTDSLWATATLGTVAGAALDGMLPALAILDEFVEAKGDPDHLIGPGIEHALTNVVDASQPAGGFVRLALGAVAVAHRLLDTTVRATGQPPEQLLRRLAMEIATAQIENPTTPAAPAEAKQYRHDYPEPVRRA